MKKSFNLSKAIVNLEDRSQKYQKKLLSHKATKRFYTKSTLIANSLRDRSTQLLAGAGLVGVLLTTPVSTPPPLPVPVQTATISTDRELAQNLSPLVPHQPTKLTPEQAEPIEKAIKQTLGIAVKANLDGHELNHQVGYVGYEQHLKRYPSDSLDQHDEELVAGIAPGLGAWGYFTSSKAEFTTQDYLKEKYYAVAQTLYLSDWNTNFKHLRDWYRHRKILIVNPATGEAVVTVMGDAGPAKWTGKQFGASPEAMKAVSLHKGPRKGLILFLFVDDPHNQIPLGPVNKPITNLN